MPEILQADENEKRNRARSIVAARIASGRMIRPKYCTRCLRKGKIQAHHPDYNKPLDVIFMCHKCHAKLHADQNREERERREREWAAAWKRKMDLKMSPIWSPADGPLEIR